MALKCSSVNDESDIPLCMCNQVKVQIFETNVYYLLDF